MIMTHSNLCPEYILVMCTTPNAIRIARLVDWELSGAYPEYWCNKRRLTASDCQEGNRRDCIMSGNQTSGKEGGVRCVMTIVCMYA